MNTYQMYYDDILYRGRRVKPRGLDAVAVINHEFRFQPGIVYHRHGDNLAIGFVEMLQFMLGTFDIEQIAVVAPNAKLELFTGQSSYGPRTIGQFERVIDELNVDRDSRRAVVLIADPRDIKETIPCTIAMQFQIVNNQTEFEDMNGEWLRMTVTMRSSDTVWGLPYDIIQFGGIALAVANCVHARPAHVVVNIGNSHVYKSTKLEGEEFEQLGSFVIPRVVDTWDKIHLWATTALAQLLVNPKQFIELAIRR